MSMRVEFVGDWLVIGSPTLEDIKAGYNARLDAGFVATPAGWRFYLDPCPGGMSRVINGILAGDQPVTPPDHLSVYRGGRALTWFGEIVDFPDPQSPGHLLGHAGYFIRRLRRVERAARQAIKEAGERCWIDMGLCRVIGDEKISVIIPRDEDGYPVEMSGEAWVYRAAWFHFNCRISQDYDLIPD